MESITKLKNIINEFKNSYNKKPYNYSYIKLDKPIKINNKDYKKIEDMCEAKKPIYYYDEFDNCYIRIGVKMEDKKLYTYVFLCGKEKQCIPFIVLFEKGSIVVTEKLNYITFDTVNGEIIIENIKKHKPVLKIYSQCDYHNIEKYGLKEKDITIENKQDLKKLKMKCLLEGINYEEL